MAGFRTFATGEVLTAANVNDFLMKQSVMVFDDAGARTAALGAQVAEGMLTFNKDTGALEVFDGTNFVAAGAEPNLVAVHYAETTAPLAFGSVASGGNASITGLSLNGLALSDASNKFLINCTAGQVHNSTGYPEAGLAVAANGTLLSIGDASGIKARVTSGPITRGHDLTQTNNRAEISTLNILFAPGDTTARDFTARIINISSFNSTMFVNRTRTDANDVRHTRAASTLTIMEVRG